MDRYAEAANRAGIRFDLEGVTHILTDGPRAAARFQPLGRFGTASIFYNLAARPRARLMGRPLYTRDARDTARWLARLGAEARERAIVEDPDRPLPAGAPASGTAAVVCDLPETVAVETRSSAPAYLVLADTFDPGWTATLDGRPVPIRPADVAFRAVLVPEGRHRVVFRYCPVGFRTGLAVSLAGLAAALFGLVRPGRGACLRPEHGRSGWPASWPWWLGGGVAVVLLLSVVAIGPTGRPAVRARWSGSFHRFTWGAGIESMRPAPPPED